MRQLVLTYPKSTALTLGALTVLGFAPYYAFFLPWLTLAGLFYLWQHTNSPKSAWQLGFSFGLGLYGIGIYWIYISLHDFGGMPWWFAGFCTFCLCAFMALFPAWVGWLAKRLGCMAWTVPVLWGLSDWVRSWIFTGFPWLTLGYSQAPNSPLVGYLPILGVYGVSIITAGLAFLISQCVYTTSKQASFFKAHWQPLLLVLLISLVGAGLSQAPWSHAVGKPISVALVQGNIGQDLKWSPDHVQTTMVHYLNLVEQTQAQLIVLPETALPLLAQQVDPAYLDRLSAHAKQQQGDILLGMVQVDTQTSEYFNSALSYGSSPTQSYSKSHLVPFGEYIPLKKVFGWIYRDWLHMPLSDLSRGRSHAPLTLAGQQVGVNICYEDVFGEEIIQSLPEAQLLVNMSNDAWYGQSFAAHQHMQFSQVRAIETARMMLRATNTGATAIIDPHGQVLAHAPHDEVNIVQGHAQSYTGLTPYARWGNWPFIFISFALLAWVLRGRFLSKKVMV